MSSDEVTRGRAWSLDVLQGLLTRERLGSYLAACDADLGRAFDLYEWNLAASAAVMHLTAMVEVIVRNSLDERLCVWANDRGLDSWLYAAPLDERGREDISRALGRATRANEATPPHGRVVSELNLGFWRYLTTSRYHASLWVPGLSEAFSRGNQDLRERRRQVESRLARIMHVRNRAAHHEPIHRRDLLADVSAAVDLADWVHRDAGRWVAATTALPSVVAVSTTLENWTVSAVKSEHSTIGE